MRARARRRSGCCSPTRPSAVTNSLRKAALISSSRAGVTRRVLLLAEDGAPSAAGCRCERRSRRWHQVLARGRAPGSRSRSWRRRASRRSEACHAKVPVSGLAPHVLHPGLHARVLSLQNARVAVGQVHVQGTIERRVGPRGGGGAPRAFSLRTIRDDVRDGAVRLLVGRHVAQPLGEEAGHVHVEGGGAGEDLRVARPAQPLVALRAVGGDVHEVAALAPEDVVLELVEQSGSSTSKLPAPGHVGVDHDAGERVERVGSPGQPVTVDVAEAVEGEARLEDLLGCRP